MILIILFAAVKVTIIKIIIMIIIMIIIVTISRINRCATELVLPRSLFGTNGLPSPLSHLVPMPRNHTAAEFK